MDAFDSIHSMVSGITKSDFKKAVFIVENAYYENTLDVDKYYTDIQFYASICEGLMNLGNIEYTESDYPEASAQYAVFVFMTDTIPILIENDIIGSVPFSYNYEDFSGQKDWSNMFVSTLIDTNMGNCHSMPYLYKMIMDELGYESHLALAPNHIYIKVNNKGLGWYNMELTSGKFPTDAWFMASSFIHTDAVRNGIYMKALNDKESIALCLVDLAQGYQYKYGIGDGDFILKCCNTALEYFPNYINALLLKSEILSYLYQQEPEENSEILSELTDLVSYIYDLGYRKMPQEMYENWLSSLTNQQTDHRLNSIIIKE